MKEMGPVNQRVQVQESLLRSPTQCGWSSTGDRLSAGKPRWSRKASGVPLPEARCKHPPLHGGGTKPSQENPL
jgi:hypothetical protein